MTSFVVDAWAWVEYLDGSPKGKQADRLMQAADVLWTSPVTIGEVVSKYRRSGREHREAVRAISALSKIGAPSLEDSVEAGAIHAELNARVPNFGLADSFVLQLARKTGSRVLTGDPDFKSVKEAHIIR